MLKLKVALTEAAKKLETGDVKEAPESKVTEAERLTAEVG